MVVSPHNIVDKTSDKSSSQSTQVTPVTTRADTREFLYTPIAASNNTTCGRNVCKNGEACCDGFCYNPYTQVCLNGRLGAFICDGILYDAHVKSSNFYCKGELICPLGEEAFQKCAALSYCNGEWCDYPQQCCGGKCSENKPFNCDRGGCWVRDCGPQITSKDIDLENPPLGLKNPYVI